MPPACEVHPSDGCRARPAAAGRSASRPCASTFGSSSTSRKNARAASASSDVDEGMRPGDHRGTFAPRGRSRRGPEGVGRRSGDVGLPSRAPSSARTSVGDRAALVRSRRARSSIAGRSGERHRRTSTTTRSSRREVDAADPAVVTDDPAGVSGSGSRRARTSSTNRASSSLSAGTYVAKSFVRRRDGGTTFDPDPPARLASSSERPATARRSRHEPPGAGALSIARSARALGTEPAEVEEGSGRCGARDVPDGPDVMWRQIAASGGPWPGLRTPFRVRQAR